MGGYHRGDDGEGLRARVVRTFGKLAVLSALHELIGWKLWHGQVTALGCCHWTLAGFLGGVGWDCVKDCERQRPQVTIAHDLLARDVHCLRERVRDMHGAHTSLKSLRNS